jgi:HEAT repeat protein
MNSFKIRTRALLFLCLLCSGIAIAQEPVLQSYMQIFSRADLSAKTDIIKTAAADSRVEFMGELYEFALQFAIFNSQILKNDPDMLNLVSLAARGAGDSGSVESLDTLWNLLSSYQDSITRVEILMAIGKLGNSSSKVIENLNNYLAHQSSIYSSGINVDYPVLSACIAAVAELGDSSSYPALFTVLNAGFPEVIVLEASGAMDLIRGDYKQFLVDVIQKNPPEEKIAAFKAGMSSSGFGTTEQGQLAEVALEQGLAFGSIEDNAALSALRYSAIAAITRLQWTRASALAIRHYYRVQTDFQQGVASKELFLEAIACLGAIGSSDAALALALQLGLINARTERTGSFDEDITLAVIQALGLIGDKSAFDYLFYISYLNYPDHIQVAAKEALDRFRW